MVSEALVPSQEISSSRSFEPYLSMFRPLHYSPCPVPASSEPEILLGHFFPWKAPFNQVPILSTSMTSREAFFGIRIPGPRIPWSSIPCSPHRLWTPLQLKEISGKHSGGAAPSWQGKTILRPPYGIESEGSAAINQNPRPWPWSELLSFGCPQCRRQGFQPQLKQVGSGWLLVRGAVAFSGATARKAIATPG